MRKDGKLVYYTIQAHYLEDGHSRKDVWFDHIDCLEAFRWDSISKGYTYDKTIARQDDPTTSGYAWQIYGQHGVTNLKAVRSG